MEVFIFILVAAAIIAGVVYSAIATRKRREAMFLLATQLGLNYSQQRNTALPAEFRFLNRLAQGSNRYAFNVLSGNYRGHDVLAFDYHYETYSNNSKGGRRTHHHYFSCFILRLTIDCPELLITREGWLSKIAQALGYDDIDFESAEFSRKFCVRSKQKRFAYDICNPQMIEYLLDNDDLSIEIESRALALMFSKCLAPEEIARNLERLCAVRERFPDYLFVQR
jgi:hypothetical protein